MICKKLGNPEIHPAARPDFFTAGIEAGVFPNREAFATIEAAIAGGEGAVAGTDGAVAGIEAAVASGDFSVARAEAEVACAERAFVGQEG